jgi:hypothetical protein
MPSRKPSPRSDVCRLEFYNLLELARNSNFRATFEQRG